MRLSALLFIAPAAAALAFTAARVAPLVSTSSPSASFATPVPRFHLDPPDPRRSLESNAPDDVAHPTQSSAAGEIQLLSFSCAAADGIDDLLLRGRNASIEHQRWEPILEPRITVHNEFPRTGSWKVEIRNQKGRSKVEILESPSINNDYLLRVRIDDEKFRAAAPLSFDLVAVPSLAPARPYNVVFITLDTLRADRLGCYGYTRPTSPNIDRFARDCVLFTDAWSTSSFTPPAHASMFTSQYVTTHGLLAWKPGLPDAALTLAEIFKHAGYRTAASVNLSLLSALNLGQGFDDRKERKADHGHDLREARVITSDGLEVIRGSSRKPFFTWLHYYDIHAPYARHPGWARRFNPNGRPGVGDDNLHYNRFPSQVEKLGFSEDDLRFISDRYDAGVAYVDAQLGPLLDELSTPQRRADTLVVMTSDHGENLLEHRERIFTHDPFLHRVVTHVPLLIRFPNGLGAGLRPDGLVSLIDIAPTILEVVGLDRPASYQGLSLLPLLSNSAWPRTEVFMEAYGWQQQVKKAARSKSHYVHLDQKAGKTTFYDLASDPDEQSPLTSPPSPHAALLLERLHAFIAANGAPARIVEPEDMDETTRKMLEGLGYVGSDDDPHRDPDDAKPQKRRVNEGRSTSRPATTMRDENP